ncbi:hypothetical protein [Sphingorhabdus sp. Alg239-R122]|uniref:hypothetical protein n=1 Tax=Sphingorhabdus sp. Alg239-R122 TaxID=2305989 RepID=UPI0013DB77F0|nr:hypothetical protein [Sphingorhabdus sp. Alg239-R122]
MRLLIIAILLYALPVAAWSQTGGPIATPADKQYQLALDLAKTRGKALYEYDQAARYTAAALREDVAAQDIAKVRGWVVTRQREGLLVTYYGIRDDAVYPFYSALWDGVGQVLDRQLLMQSDDAVLTDMQLRLIAAGDSASAVNLKNCSNLPFNPVILPADVPGGADLVYYLTPQMRGDLFPLGGHYRFEIAGDRVQSFRSFTNSCVNVRTKAQGDNAAPEALMFTHSLDSAPTEAQVFAVFSMGIPLYVKTEQNGLLWLIEIFSGEPSITLVDQNAE